MANLKAGMGRRDAAAAGRRWLLLGLGSLALAAGTARGQSAGDETAVPLAKLPAGVLEAAKKAAPGVTLRRATTTLEEGKTYFDLYGKDGQGREVDVEVSARGKVLGVATEIELGEVPAPVMKALKAKARGVKFTGAEAVTKDGALISYRLEGKNADGDDVEATVSPDGRRVEIEVD